MLGPIGFVRRYLRKFASWALLFSMAYLTYWALSKSHLHAFWAAPGKGGFPSFGQAVDLVIGNVVSWTPLAADYTRFSRTRRGAALGAGLGYFVPTIWCIGLGIVIVLASVDATNKITLVAGVTADQVGKVKAGELVGSVAQQVGGKGGGRPDFAQAGGNNPAGLPAALASVEPFVRSKLGA